MKKIFMITILLAIAILSSCSTIRYKSKKFDGLIVLDSSYYNKPEPIEIVSKDSNTGYTIVKSLSQDSVLQSIESFDNEKDRNFIGESKYYHSNGKLKKVKYYKNKNLYSSVKTYYANGQLKRNDIFNDRVFVSGTCFDSLGNEIPHTDYEIDPYVDLEELESCLVYPKTLRRAGIQEYVIIMMLLTEEGKVAQFRYDKENSKAFVDSGIDRILKLTGNSNNYFVPCRIEGKLSTCWISVPITFTLRLF